MSKRVTKIREFVKNNKPEDEVVVNEVLDEFVANENEKQLEHFITEIIDLGFEVDDVVSKFNEIKNL